MSKSKRVSGFTIQKPNSFKVLFMYRMQRKDRPDLLVYIVPMLALILSCIITSTITGVYAPNVIAIATLAPLLVVMFNGVGEMLDDDNKCPRSDKIFDLRDQSWFDQDLLDHHTGASEESEYSRRCWKYLHYLDGGGVRSEEVEQALDVWRTVTRDEVMAARAEVNGVSPSNTVEALHIVAIDDDALNARREAL